ncbi:hypothetical protein ACI78Q_19235 [Geodermatophilus sp. SYSU D00705]
MRRRTALGLGAVTAAAALAVGLGGTTAVLSDTASVPAAVGAGSLSLSNQQGDAAVEFRPGRDAIVPLRAQVDGGGRVVLQVSLVAADPAVPCPEKVGLTVDVASGTWQKPVELCDLAPAGGSERPVSFLVMDSAKPSTDLSLTLRATGGPSAKDPAWDGALRFTLRQTDGGFSDSADVAVRLVPPSPQNATPAVPKGNRSAGAAVTGGTEPTVDVGAGDPAVDAPAPQQPVTVETPETAPDPLVGTGNAGTATG